VLNLLKELPPQTINVDACVIESQPEHLVLAVRVPKQVIRNNTAFMAAASELAAGATARNARPLRLPAVPAVVPHKLKKASVGLSLGFLGAVGAMLGFWLIPESGTAVHVRPIETTATWASDPVITPGQPLTIHFTTIRRRLCKTDVERVVLTRELRTVYAVRQTGIGQAITDQPITRTLAVKIPDGLKPGHYLYRAAMFSDCGGGETYADQLPDVPFEIRP